MKVKEAIEFINNSKFKTLEDVNIDAKIISELEDVIELYYHNTATNYYQLEDGILGIYGAYNVEDFVDYFPQYCEAFEAEKYFTTAYREKIKPVLITEEWLKSQGFIKCTDNILGIVSYWQSEDECVQFLQRKGDWIVYILNGSETIGSLNHVKDVETYNKFYELCHSI